VKINTQKYLVVSFPLTAERLIEYTTEGRCSANKNRGIPVRPPRSVRATRTLSTYSHSCPHSACPRPAARAISGSAGS
jgi:hypothetical protein